MNIPLKKFLSLFFPILVFILVFSPLHSFVVHAQVDSACSATNVDSDDCYQQECTGQASEDSQSCNDYANQSSDENGTGSCSSINSSNEADCCPDNNDSPVCAAYENYTDADAAGATGAGAQCPNTSITSDSAYEHQCTGQADEDSVSCQAYATCDDGGNAECADIQNDTVYNDCCNGDSGDSAVCVAYNTSSASDANSPSAARKSGSSPAAARLAQIVAGAAKVASGAKAAGGSAAAVNNSTSGDGLVPCDGQDCTFNSVLQLINNLINFFFTKLLFPIVIFMVVYLGYTYLTAGGNPAQHAKAGSMAKHLVLGILLMLCAWLIVHTILSIIGYQDTLGFFG